MASDAPRIYPTQYWFVGQGGQGTVSLVAPEDLEWTASSSEPSWLSLTSAASGKGSAQLTYTVATNQDTYRNATLTVAGLQCLVLQLPLPEWQEQQVLGAPMPYLEQVGLKGFIDEIKKLPPEAQPVAFGLLLGAVEAAGVAGEALYTAVPRVPQQYTPKFIDTETNQATDFIKKNMVG